MSKIRKTNNTKLVPISCMINGEPRKFMVRPWETALTVLRETLGLTGTKEGCGIGECGACTILVDGSAVDSCLMLAPQMDGREIMTVEGLGGKGSLHPLQEAFLEEGAVQCGFCTPGVLMSAKALLDAHPHPGREQIVEALSGNLCRCTGYQQIIQAVEEASQKEPSARSGRKRS